MNNEENRLASFSTWPADAPIDAASLAKAGFYYCGEGKRIKCFGCGLVISDWDYSDQALLRHYQKKPNCPLIVYPYLTTNVPLNSTNEQEVEDQDYVRSGVVEHRYRRRSQRYLSFINWPLSEPVSPGQLANAGFYYLGRDNMVQCAFCKVVIGNWEPGVDPEQERRLHFPNCDYMRCTREESEKNNEKLLNNTAAQLEQLGIQAHTIPVQPKGATYEYRLKTFNGWPKHLNQTPEMLAEAGFYYFGHEDYVRCFHCDGGLVKWESNDDAWVEHARWFPKCGFVAMVQGQKFIEDCIKNRPPLETSQGVCDQITDSSNKNDMPSTSSATSSEPLAQSLTCFKSEVVNTLPSDKLRNHVENSNRQTDDENQPLDSLHTELALILNQFNNEQEEQCNSIENNCDERISHSSEDVQAQNDEMKNGVIDDTHEEKHLTEGNKKEEKSNDTDILLEEIRRLKEARLCKICMDRDVTIVFLPCGHLVTCVYCVPSLTHCPMCRKTIIAIVRTFLA